MTGLYVKTHGASRLRPARAQATTIAEVLSDAERERLRAIGYTE